MVLSCASTVKYAGTTHKDLKKLGKISMGVYHFDRQMGTCFATGQAAGMASALYASGVIDVGEQAQAIQKLLH